MSDRCSIELEARIGIQEFLESLGPVARLHLLKASDPEYKEAVRHLHKQQRFDRAQQAKRFVEQNFMALAPYFARGADINPKKITPHIELVKSGTRESDLFRLASLVWSVPVSEGYGRRMRFLVWDEYNGKLIGIFALGDPVFNLGARDKIIGWSSADRSERLVNMLDAYVLGAVPPYSQLLGGKLIACLIRTLEVKNHFAEKYGVTQGIISKRVKQPSLVAVSTTSSLGRSSIYNRLTLDEKKYFSPIGFTSGFGHFHISVELFEKLRRYLESINHAYAAGNRFGNGPNWKFRAIRAAFESLGVSRDILQHGIHREVFLCEMADNSLAVLNGEDQNPTYLGLKGLGHVAGLALDRWVIPRSRRNPSYLNWSLQDMFGDLKVTASFFDQK